ncbi:MAG: hypothetical protein DCC49_10750 [Acidobacteria bacterium]|nr:MAG: hypothetical protein DCC49_10750 [Acidobacteriota bacterium]
MLLGPKSGRVDIEPALAELRSQMGLDRSLPVQYGIWTKRVVMGDFGASNRSGVPVREMVFEALPVTLWLIGLALVVALPISIFLGIVGAANERRAIGRVVRLIATISLATPAFWIGIILIEIFAVKLDWLPAGGYVSLLDSPVEFAEHMVLPVAALATFMIGVLTRYVYAEAIEVRRQPYIRTAHAEGLPGRVIELRFVARNALIPLIAVAGAQVGALIGGAVLSEQLFGLPGVGQLVLNGVLGRDYQVVQGTVLITTVFVLLITEVAEVAYRLVDPRLRT